MKLSRVILVVFILFLQFFQLVQVVFAASSPWAQTNWSTGDFSASSGVVTSTANQVTLNNTEKLSNTGFESDLTGWSTTSSGGTFDSTGFAAASGAVAAWPLDDTTTTQSYARVVNPAVATGRNIVINGGFDTDTIWTKGTGWTISGGTGVATTAAIGAVLSQSIPMVIGKAYSITYTAVVTTGSVKVQAGTGSSGATRSTSGTFTETLIATTSTTLQFNPVTTFTGTIDNVSVTQLNIPAYTATPTQLLADGDMETAGTTAWTGVNSATLSKETTSPHGGANVLRVARNGVSTPYSTQTVLTSGSVYRVTGYVRSDGSATPKVYHNGTGTTLFTGTTSTSWQPFDVVFVAAATNIGFGTSTNTGTQYVEFDDVVVSLDTGIRSGELLQDGNMETALTASGTASSGGATTLTDSGKSFVTNSLTGQLLSITAGTGSGQTRTITSNTATDITTAAWTTNPDNTSQYQIIPYWGINSASLSKQTTTQHGGGSGQVLRVLRTGSTASGFQNVMKVGKKYRVTGWARSDGVSSPQITDFIAVYYLGTASTSWTFFDVTFIAQNVAMGVVVGNGVNGVNYVDFDDVSVTEVDPLVGLVKQYDSSGNLLTTTPTLGSSTGTGGHLTNAYTFDGTNDNVNVYSSDLNSAFNPSEGTLVAWAKVSGSGVWTDGVARYTALIRADSNNQLSFLKNTSNNQLVFNYLANGTSEQILHSSFSPTGWFQIGITWSKSSDEVKAYINGAQTGSTQTALETWVGNLGTGTVTIGSNTTGGQNPWSGMINDVRLYNRALSSSEISTLYNGVVTTRDTTTTYAGSSGSAKIVVPSDQVATVTQSVNVGDTNSYNLVAYAYTTGAAVTSADAALSVNGSPISTTYTSVGSGWYKLSGTVTGVASAITYGVEVEAGKTVYVDNLSLNNYASSGTLTSSIFDSGFASNWGVLTFVTTTPTNATATVKVRTSTSATMSGATAFASCSAITSGTDISSNSCVTDGQQYAQYLITLASSDLLNTPTFTSFSLAFANAVSPTGSIVINSGTTYTNVRGVTLTLGTTDDIDSAAALQMEVSENSSFTGASYEAFSTSKSFTLSTGDGVHTVYAHFKDADGNVSATYSDTITLDTTAPVSIDLTSPDNNAYTNNDRPTFKWKTTTDATSGVAKYLLITPHFTIDNIPTTGSADVASSKYTIHFENFNDNDATNNYISVYTKSSSDWGPSENDGKLSEGAQTWTVKAVDTATNETSTSRTLTVDRTPPGLTATIENQGIVNGYLISTSTSPKVTGTATDTVNIDSVQVQYYRQSFFLGVITDEKLIATKLVTRDSTYTSTATTWSFTVSLSDPLEYGKYRVVTQAFDRVGNSSPPTILYLSLLPQEKAQVLLPEQHLTPGEASGKLSIPDLERQAIVRKEKEAQELTKLTDQLVSIFIQIQNFLTKLFGQTTQFLALAYNSIAQSLSVIQTQILAFSLPTMTFPTITLPQFTLPEQLVSTSTTLANSINAPMEYLKKQMDTGIKIIGIAMHQSIAWIGMTMQEAGRNAWVSYESGRDTKIAAIRNLWHGKRIAPALNLALTESKKPVIATKGFLHKLQISYDTVIAIMFDDHPTVITDVTIEEIGDDYAIVSYKTNHRAWGKVNYGSTLSYGNEVMLPLREFVHKARLTGLKPGEKYFFEVMAQNKNYAYDAYYVLEVPAKNSRIKGGL